jgi:hypothetical protein
MALAQDLMGLGISPLQAAHTSNGGTGPVFSGGTLAGATSAFSTTNRLGAFQFVVTVSNGVSTGGVCLPAVGGDSGCLIADDYVINNSGTTTIYLFASSGVAISVRASNTGYTQIALHTTMTLFPLSTTQWVGIAGS